MPQRIPATTWSAVGGNLLSTHTGGVLTTTPATPTPLQVMIQADLASSPAAYLLIGFAGMTPTAANAEYKLANGQAIGGGDNSMPPLPAGTIIGWALVDANDVSITAGANDYIRINACQLP